jgi:hypothetical protein
MRTLPTSLALPIMVSAAFISWAPAQASETLNFRTSAPTSFNDLDADRQLVVDVYVRGQSVGQANVRVSRGKVTFDNPLEVVGRIPDLLAPGSIERWLREPLAGNAGRACGRSPTSDCGFVETETVAVILDEDRFRLDLFIHSSQFASAGDRALYLPEPDARATLISRFGGTVAAGTGDESFLLQNRTILASGKYRLRSDSSVMSGRGLAFDNLSVERDLKDWRQVAGLFWAPGSDLVGRRKIIGAGMMTQLDTRLDRRTMIGTPLTVALQAPARVDLFIDGRLVASRIYSPGDVVIDTASLPDGSYDVEMRIAETGRPERTERRFFNKGADLAPTGRPLFGLMGGFFADERGRPDWSVPYYQLSGAVRVSADLGIDARLLGTSRKVIAESGATWLTPFARFRAAGLVSSKGDWGAVLRGSTAYGGPVALSFDLRTIKSANGAPLLPETRSLGSFSEENDAQIGDVGSYTQGSVYLTARWRTALLRLSGLYRKSGGERASYSIAGSVETPVARSDRWNLVFQADVRKTNRDVAALIGLRASLVNPAWTAAATAGLQHEKGKGTAFAGELQASATKSLAPNAQVTGNAAIATDRSGTSARAGADLATSNVNLRGDVLHSFGHGGGTQFAGSFDTAIVGGASRVSLGARNVTDGAIVIVPSSDRADQKFEVLVEGGVRGIATQARPLTLFLQPYEQYRVRIRPTGESLSTYDSAEKLVSLYPGRVETLEWEAHSTRIAFGRLVEANGDVLAGARINGKYAIGQTDDGGYFQIEAAMDEKLNVTAPSGQSCVAALGKGNTTKAYQDAGVITCR